MLSCIASACEGGDRKALYAAFSGALDLLRRIDEDAARFITAPPTIEHADWRFPYVSALPKYGTPNEEIRFQIRWLHPDTKPNRLLYIAETLDEELIIMKFTRRYSIDLRRFCASRRHAPHTFGFGEFPGGWSVIVMDYNSPTVHPSRSPNLSRFWDKWMGDFQNLIQSFHDQGLVHGDLREPNMICDEENNNLMLIDFDWGGEVWVVYYPTAKLCAELTDGRHSTDTKITKDDDRRVLQNALKELEK